jgi:hypothetical protein
MSHKIRQNLHAPRRYFGARLCLKDQPQRFARVESKKVPEPSLLAECCGWCFAHSRAPLVAALLRCVLCASALKEFVEDAKTFIDGGTESSNEI